VSSFFRAGQNEDWGLQIVFDTSEEQQQTPWSFSPEEGKLTFFMNAKGWAASERDRLAQIKSISALFLIKASHGDADVDKIIAELIFRAK
jgi:hypothetical protein